MADYCEENRYADIKEVDINISIASSTDGLHSSMDEDATLPSYRYGSQCKKYCNEMNENIVLRNGLCNSALHCRSVEKILLT